MSPEDIRNPPWAIVFTVVAGVVLLALSMWFASPSQSGYTLYRDNASDNGHRIYVATFKDVDDAQHNRENCEGAATQLLQRLRSIGKAWCEVGGYRP